MPDDSERTENAVEPAGGSGGDMYARPGGTRESRLMRKIARHRFDVLYQTAEHVDGVAESLKYLRNVVRLHGESIDAILNAEGEVDMAKVKALLPGREARLAAEALLRHQRMVAQFEDLPDPPAPDPETGEKPEVHIHLHGPIIAGAARAFIEATVVPEPDDGQDA